MCEITDSSTQLNASPAAERTQYAPCQPKRRVLFLLPSLGGGGSECVLITLLNHLDRQLFDLHLGVVNATGPLREQVPEDVILHDLKLHRVRYSLQALLRLIWKVRPETILSTLGHLNLALLVLRPLLPQGIRLCVRESTILSAAFRTEKQSPLWSQLHRWLYPTADTVICQSDGMRDDLAQIFGIPARKLVRIYNPVDIRRLSQMAHGESPYPAGGPQLVASGRLERAKGFDLLLTATALVRKSLSGVRLTILGDGSLREELCAQRNALGLQDTVTFAGYVPNPYRYYLHANLFVLSSRYEGLPNAMLEAIALGAPVVATACPGGVREILELSDVHNLVPVEEPSLLAAGIIAALTKPSKRITAEQQQIARMVNLDEVVHQYADLLLN